MPHVGLRRLIGRLVHDFEYDHRAQLRFHLVMMVFWMANLAVGTAVMIFDYHLWLAVGVYYVFVLSIYANWDTDYDAVSASQAAMHSQDLLDKSGQ